MTGRKDHATTVETAIEAELVRTPEQITVASDQGPLAVDAQTGTEMIPVFSSRAELDAWYSQRRLTLDAITRADKIADAVVMARDAMISQVRGLLPTITSEAGYPVKTFVMRMNAKGEIACKLALRLKRVNTPKAE